MPKTKKKPYIAATRRGMAKVTTNLDPALRRALKVRCAQEGVTIESFIRDAIASNLAKRR